MKLGILLSLMIVASASSVSKAGIEWECHQGVAPYEDKVIIDVSTDKMKVKRGSEACDLLPNAGSSVDENGYLSYQSMPRTCTEIFSSGYRGEVSWLEAVHFPVNPTSNLDSIRPVLFDIGMWDDLGASRPYALQYLCNVKKTSKPISNFGNTPLSFDWPRYGDCGYTPQGFQVCYHATCQSTCRETIFLIKDGVERSYPIVDPINEDYRILRAVTLKDSAGNMSSTTIKYYHERATYPGDGEYYPIHLSGSTPDGVYFDIDVKGRNF